MATSSTASNDRPVHCQAPRAAYVHVPFCARRCGYCNFTVVAGRDDLVPRYLEALERELGALGQAQPVDTRFLGGGTPTQLRGDDLEQLLALVQTWFPITAGGEFSVEANPEDVEPAQIAQLVAAGVNRISLGAQSFDEGKLIALERLHNRAAIERSFELARQSGALVSLDLMFAAPGERLRTWQRDLELAVQLAPDHVSTYGLTVERGTQFWNRRHRGHLNEVDEELQRQMYETAIDTLTAAGYEHYEVSNFARPGARCLHNQVYWQGRPYFGLGPGAASYVDGRRQLNHRSTSTYMRRVLSGQSPVEMTEQLSAEERARERLVFGLRMLSGVQEAEFAAETGFSVRQLAADAVDRFCDAGLLQRSEGRLQLTREGLLISDSLWPELL